jgi:hypothetical protein
MKSLIVIMFCLVLLAGCVTAQCPSQKIYSFVWTPHGPAPFFFRLGDLGESTKGERWWASKDEMFEYIEEQLENYEPMEQSEDSLEGTQDL